MATSNANGKSSTTEFLRHADPSTGASRSASRSHAAPSRQSAPRVEPTTPLGFPLRMLMPAMLCGLGTSGAKMVQRIIAILESQLGRLPTACNYLLVDGASPDLAVDPRHFLALDLAGCGTNPHRGRQRFYAEYQRIRYALDQHLRTIDQFDPEVRVDNSPRDFLAVWIFAGCGGSSAGLLHPMITLAHDVARQQRIRQVRVFLVLMGADMPLRDSSHSVLLEQKLIVPDNCANNLIKVFADMASAAEISEPRPDGTVFTMPAADRVWAVSLVDQSNGFHEWSTTEELVEMVAWDYFLQIFTEVGKYLEDRNEDHERTGVVARGTL